VQTRLLRHFSQVQQGQNSANFRLILQIKSAAL